MRSSLWIRLAILGFFMIQVVAPANIYKIVRIDCFTRLKYSKNAVCKLKPVNRYKAVANMDVDLIRPCRNISINMQILKRNDANKYQPFLVNVTQNMCDVLAKRSYNPYFLMLYNIIKKRSNVNHTCPFEGHMFARDLYIDERTVPMPLPVDYYKVDVQFLEGYPYESFGEVILYIEALARPIDSQTKTRNSTVKQTTKA